MLTLEHKRQFSALVGRLSPENLHCDGEISRAQAMVRKRQIMKEWKALERAAGVKVSESDVYGWENLP